MPTLGAWLLATPFFGFVLSPPATIESTDTAVSRDAIELEVDDRAAEAHNASMMEWTRSLSLASVVAFTGAGVLGAIQFYDEYGFRDDFDQTPCARGTAVLDYCGESTPWAHLVAVGATAGLGLGTFIFSTQVDYDRAARIDSDWRIYEVTRWVGLVAYVAQGIGGFLLANAIRFGWADEQNDFDTLQTLATAHLAFGASILGLEMFNTAILF